MPECRDDRPTVGVSACLLGEAVRYDGRDKRHARLVDELGPRVHWVSICPEVEAGLGVPREPIRLEQRDGGIRVRRVETRTDLTERLASWAQVRLAALPPLDGYVLKSGSPSCGRKQVPVHDEQGEVIDENAGFFARALRASFPDLPIVTEQDLETAGNQALFLLVVQSRFRTRRGGPA